MNNRVIFIPYGKMGEFYNCFVIALFLKHHQNVTFIRYIKENCFKGKYRGKESLVFLFKAPVQSELGENESFYVFQRRISKKSDEYRKRTEDSFNKEYSLFLEDPYYYIMNNLFEGQRLSDIIEMVMPFGNDTQLFREEEILLYKYKKVFLEEKTKFGIPDDYKEKEHGYVQDLLDGILTFSNPDCFNDPFDCDCNIPIGLKTYLLGLFLDFCNKRTKKVIDKEELEHRYNRILENGVDDSIERYQNALMILARDLLDNIYLGELQDELRNANIKYDDLKRDFRVLCMAKDPKDILMWGYYCDGGQGVSVEFYQNKIIEGLSRLENSVVLYGDVSYLKKEQKPKLKVKKGISSYDLMKYIIECVFSKYEAWKHEKERRFVLLKKPEELYEMGDYIGVKVDRENCYLGLHARKMSMDRNKYSIGKWIQLEKDLDEYALTKTIGLKY